MKIIKYLTVALLVVLVSKKVHVKEDSAGYNSTYTPTKLGDTAKNNDESALQYDPIRRTAIFKGKHYVGVKPYNTTVTPPDIAAPALKPITLIKNPNYVNKGLLGSSSQQRLFGIPVGSHSLDVKNSEGKTIGQYFKKEQIVQLNNGATYVGIIATHVPNYKKTKPEQSKTPSTQSVTKTLAQYGLTYDNTLLPRIIGEIHQGRQTSQLTGYMLYPRTTITFATVFEEIEEMIR